MVLTKEDFRQMVLTSARLLKEHVDTLCEIDSSFGDGDHGVTMDKISTVMIDSASSWTDESIEAFFVKLCEDVMGTNGGSAGPLYGSFFEGFGEGASGLETIDESGLKKMFNEALANLRFISKAQIGEKTMMDALLPTIEVANTSTSPLPELLDEIAKAAEQGAEDSKKYVAKYGRARFFKEQTIGFMDAGAYSMKLIIEGFAKGIRD